MTGRPFEVVHNTHSKRKTPTAVSLAFIESPILSRYVRTPSPRFLYSHGLCQQPTYWRLANKLIYMFRAGKTEGGGRGCRHACKLGDKRNTDSDKTRLNGKEGRCMTCKRLQIQASTQTSGREREKERPDTSVEIQDIEFNHKHTHTQLNTFLYVCVQVRSNTE